MSVEPMEPEELIGYFQIHSRTQRALFHKLHFAQLREMAGNPIEPDAYQNMGDFISVSSEAADTLIERARIKVLEPGPPQGWNDDPLE